MRKCLFFFFLLVWCSYVAQAQNLIPNGSFESDFSQWFTEAASGTNASFSIVNDAADGTKAMRVEVVTPGPNPWNVQAINDAWASEAGKSYTLSFYAKAATAGSQFKVIQQNTTYAERIISLTTAWQKYEWTFTAQESGLQLKFHFPNAGTFFIDANLIPAQVPVQTQNLIPNGSFESDFSRWFTQAAAGTNASFSIVSDAVDGTKAMQVAVITPGANPWNVQAVNDPWASESGKPYTLSFYAKAATAGSQFKVIQQNLTYTEQIITLTTSWQRYKWTFTAQEAGLQLKFHFPNAGTFFIDNISIPQAVAQNQAVVIQAESGTPVAASSPAVFATLDEGTVRFVRVVENFAATQSPGTDSRVLSYSVTFPKAGTYNLYARLRVGSGGFDDDSFYYGNGFGSKSATSENDWITVNGLNSGGHTASTDIVTGGGTAANNVWKWINLSTFAGQGEAPIQFTVPEGSLTQTFQVGSRENGLEFDQFAFGPAGIFFTVDNLDKGEAGTENPPPPPFTPKGPPMATGKEKFVGGVYSTSQKVNFTAYFNQVVPENAGKWGSVEGTRDVMNWAELDSSYLLARNNGFPFRFHVLIWGNQQPAWIENLPPAEQLEEIKEWYAAVAERYPDIDFLEVVNEPTNDPPNQPGSGGGNYINALGGNGATGWDWVLTSFRMARQYFPNAQLMINDYNVENNPTNAQRYLGIINLLKAENLIDAIGLQGHAFSTRTASDVLRNILDQYAATGLPIYITELDIDGPTDAAQLQDYQRIFPLYWEHPSVRGITLWGYRPGHWRTQQGAYLAYENGAERPALVWLQAYVRNIPPVVTAGQTFILSEGAANTAVVGTVQATDADTTATTFQGWQITGGTGAGIFSINASTGQLTVANSAALDYRTTPSYTLTVTVRDDYTSSAPQTVTIQLTPENEAPVAKFTASVTQGFAPLPVTFDASASSDPDGDTLSFAWNFGDGTTATGKTVSHTFVAPGTYTTTLTVTDPFDGSSTATTTIQVAPGLKVQYRVRQNENKATDNHIKPHFQIVNIGNQAVPYNELTIRYWYTRENATYPWAQDNTSQQFWCDYAALGTNQVKGRFVKLSAPKDSADYYLELSFTSAASLAPTRSSGEIQTRFNNANWSDFNEWGDYSYDPSKRDYTDWNRVTLYRKGVLIWGNEPTKAGAATARTASVENLSLEESWTVYPNPASGGRFTLELRHFEQLQNPMLQVMDASGKPVVEAAIQQKVHTNTQPLTPGLYMIRVSDQHGSATRKLVVE